MEAKDEHIPLTQEDLDALPLRSFDGPVHMILSPSDVESALQRAAQHPVVGFDTETRPSFKRGEMYNVALMQVATPEEVFLIRISHTKMIDEIVSFLENGHIIKAGVGLENDIRGLGRLRPFRPGGFAELSLMAREAGLKAESIKKLAGTLLGYRISKSAQVSNWESTYYTERQIRYAATDAWVCLSLYDRLCEMLGKRKTPLVPRKNAR